MNFSCEGIITSDPNKRVGKPIIRGMRITVYDVLDYLAPCRLTRKFSRIFRS